MPFSPTALAGSRGVAGSAEGGTSLTVAGPAAGSGTSVGAPGRKFGSARGRAVVPRGGGARAGGRGLGEFAGLVVLPARARRPARAGWRARPQPALGRAPLPRRLRALRRGPRASEQLRRHPLRRPFRPRLP